MTFAALSLLLIAGSTAADEGATRTYPFKCHVISAEGEARSISGTRFETDSTRNFQPIVIHSFQITDGDIVRDRTKVGQYPEGKFEVVFRADDSDESTFIPRSRFMSYVIDWSRGPANDAVITLHNWYELRPLVRMDRTVVAAGLCRYSDRDEDV